MVGKSVIAPIHYFYSGPRDLLPQEINLEGGYIIRPFNDSVLDPVFDFFRDSFSEHQKQELRNCRYAIYYSYTQQNDSGSEIPQEIATNINRILLTLRVVRRTRAIATMLHFRLQGRRRDALQVVHQPTTNVTFLNPPVGSQHFQTTDARKIRNYWRKVQYLYTTFGGTYHKVLNALFFFEIGHHNHLYKPRLVHFVTCLESLFNTSDQQIGYTLRMRCSYFLERNPTARSTLSGDIRNIYRLRSMFVHGQGAPNNILMNITLQERLLSQAEDLSRRCIQKIFDKDLIQQFGNANTLNQEFERLELGMLSALR